MAFLPTPQACAELGVSASFLKRNRDTHGGFLQPERHYLYGAGPNSAIRWEVDAIRATLHERGMQRRRADEALKAIRTEPGL